MAHMIDESKGFAGFVSRRVPAWHKLGRVVDGFTIQEGLQWSGADFTVGYRDMFWEDANGQRVKSDTRLTYRTDTGAKLGEVGPHTHVLQNADAFACFAPAVEAGELKLETAGCLDGGRKVWILASAAGDDMEIVRNDIVKRYVLLSNSHDGTMAVRLGLTPTRVVCWNTLSATIRAGNASAKSKNSTDSGTQLIRIRHGSKVKENCGLVLDMLNKASMQFEATAEQFKLLATKQIRQSDVRKFIKLCFHNGVEVADDDISTRTKNLMERVFELVETGAGVDIPGVKGTLWGTYNAYTEFLNHERGQSDETRLAANWFGANLTDNNRALELALAMAV